MNAKDKREFERLRRKYRLVIKGSLATDDQKLACARQFDRMAKGGPDVVIKTPTVKPRATKKRKMEAPKEIIAFDRKWQSKK